MEQKTILLVDDSIFISKVVSDFLIENGYQTKIVSSGEDAMTVAMSGVQLDLIIMDIELAGEISGLEAARRILEIINVPIIFLTGNATQETMHQIKEIHGYGFIQKGCNSFALLSSVEMAFNLYEANTRTKAINQQLKKSYEELDKSQRLYSELTENAPVGILRCDRIGSITFLNSKAMEIIGAPGKDEIQKVNILTFPKLVEQGFSQKLDYCLKNNEVAVHEMLYQSQWGKKVYARIHIKPFMEKTEVSGAQIIFDDITEKKQLEDELLRLSLTDPLTNAYNRRHFMQKLEEEIERVHRGVSDSFSIALLDVDHFKKINDSWGHDFGDLALKRITATVQKRIRRLDCLARWGGEEFIILFPNTRLVEAAFIAEELRNSIHKIEFPLEMKATASFGVAEYNPAETVDAIVNRADKLVYSAKASGRNCVRSKDESK